jgi:hypothetical protein
MNVCKQPELLKATPSAAIHRKVEYMPPEPQLVDRFAYAVCQTLEGQRDPNFRNGYVVQGFSAFMRVITRMRAQELTRSKTHVQKSVS